MHLHETYSPSQSPPEMLQKKCSTPPNSCGLTIKGAFRERSPHPPVEFDPIWRTKAGRRLKSAKPVRDWDNTSLIQLKFINFGLRAHGYTTQHHPWSDAREVRTRFAM